jgi:predicted deacylase
MQGILDFLVDLKDARAYFLRKYFVFVLVPMLNPDGVSRGHCRMDIFNQNLNRHYKNPSLAEQPSCYAIKHLAGHYSVDRRLFLYLDLHAHPGNKGNFIFGNAINDFVLQV